MYSINQDTWPGLSTIVLGRGKERNSDEASKPQSFLGFQFKCLYNQHIHKSLAAQLGSESRGEFCQWLPQKEDLYVCSKPAWGWVLNTQCSQKGPACEVSKAWFPMESLLPRSLAFLFPSLPPVHSVFSAVDLATALIAQFEVSWNPNLF